MKQELTSHQKLSKIFELYEQSMYFMAFSVLHHEAEAEDAVADSFEKILGCIDKIKDPESKDTKKLVLKIVKNKAIDKYRKNLYENELFTDVDNSQVKEENNLIDFWQHKREAEELFDEIARDLSDTSREILLLHCFYGLSFVEISRYLEISAATARKRFERAKQALIERKDIKSTIIDNSEIRKNFG